METIKRQTRAVRVVVWLKGCGARAHVCGLSLRPVGCMSALSVSYSAAVAADATYGAM